MGSLGAGVEWSSGLCHYKQIVIGKTWVNFLFRSVLSRLCVTGCTLRHRSSRGAAAGSSSSAARLCNTHDIPPVNLLLLSKVGGVSAPAGLFLVSDRVSHGVQHWK